MDVLVLCPLLGSSLSVNLAWSPAPTPPRNPKTTTYQLNINLTNVYFNIKSFSSWHIEYPCQGFPYAHIWSRPTLLCSHSSRPLLNATPRESNGKSIKKDLCFPDAYANTSMYKMVAHIVLLRKAANSFVDKVEDGLKSVFSFSMIKLFWVEWTPLVPTGPSLELSLSLLPTTKERRWTSVVNVPHDTVISMGGTTVGDEGAVNIPAMILVPGHPLAVEVEINTEAKSLASRILHSTRPTILSAVLDATSN